MKRKRKEDAKQQQEREVAQKKRKIAEGLATLAQQMADGSWAPRTNLQTPVDVMRAATDACFETIWEHPTEEALTEWLLGNKEKIELLQANPALRNYRIPEEVLLALKDEMCITGTVFRAGVFKS